MTIHNLNRAGLCDCTSCTARPLRVRNKPNPAAAEPDVWPDPRWTVIELDGPRLSELTPCRAEVWAVDEVLEAEREQRSRRSPLLAELKEFGWDVDRLREFLAGVREQYRRAASEPSEQISRQALKLEIDDGIFVDWEALWCFDDAAKPLSGHEFHGVAAPRRRPALQQCRDDELDYVDELRVVPEIAALHVLVLPDIPNVRPDEALALP